MKLKRIQDWGKKGQMISGLIVAIGIIIEFILACIFKESAMFGAFFVGLGGLGWGVATKARYYRKK